MKTKGRNICDTLKAIRKQIADANGIDYSPEECHFKGECKGTCPRCEQDVRDLEHELRIRQMAGKAIKVAGVALGITALAASTTSCATQKGYYSSISEKTLPILFQEYSWGFFLLSILQALHGRGYPAAPCDKLGGRIGRERHHGAAAEQAAEAQLLADLFSYCRDYPDRRGL